MLFRLKQRLGNKTVSYSFLIVVPAIAIIFFAYSSTRTDASPAPKSTPTPESGRQKDKKTDKSKKKDTHTSNSPKKDAVLASTKISSAQTAQSISVTNTSAAALGVYTGPGAVSAHTRFEQWLGRSVPYAADYIDYKGGWQKDFVDSRLWLMEPWGRWVQQAPGRRLILGLPMLENSNNGQFAEGARGDFDAYFSSLGNSLVSNGLGNSIIRLGYEGNCDTIGPWQATNNPEGYRQLYRHIVMLMRTTPGSSFSFDWSVCNGLQSGKALNSFDSFYPGDDVVDIISQDIYDVKWMDPSATPQARWQYLSSRPLGINELTRFARSHGKPLSFPEWGLYKPGDAFAGGGDDPYFIQQMTQLFNNTNPLYQAYFNLDWGGGVLSDFPQGSAAFKNIYGL